MKKVAVIILNYNGLDYLAENISSLRTQSFGDFELIIADNASQDGSLEFIEKNYPEVRLIRFEKNLGFAKGYNLAIKDVEAEYIFLMNQDMVADKDCLAWLVKTLDSDPEIAVCGSKIMFLKRPGMINHAGGVILAIGGGYDRGFGEFDRGQFGDQKYTGYVCGGAMMVSRKFFREVGGFDEDYFLYCEDVDLCWRMWLHGLKVSFVPASVIYHDSGVLNTPYSVDPVKIYFNQRNRLLCATKNFEMRNVLLSLLYNCLASSAKIIKMAFRLEFVQMFWLARGYVDFLKFIFAALRKREVVQKSRKVPDRWLFKEGLVEGIRDSFLGYKRW